MPTESIEGRADGEYREPNTQQPRHDVQELSDSLRDPRARLATAQVQRRDLGRVNDRVELGVRQLELGLHVRHIRVDHSPDDDGDAARHSTQEVQGRRHRQHAGGESLLDQEYGRPNPTERSEIDLALSCGAEDLVGVIVADVLDVTRANIQVGVCRRRNV